MAAIASPSDSDSDYGYDLTAEEEGLVSNILATISTAPPPASQQGHPPSSLASPPITPGTRAASPKPSQPPSQTQAALTHEPAFALDALTESDLDFDSSELSVSTEHNHHSHHARQTTALLGPRPPSLAPERTKRKLSPTVAPGDRRLASFVAGTAALSAPVAIAGPAIVYPDLSRALSHLQDAPNASPRLDSAAIATGTANPKTDKAAAADDGADLPPILRFRTFPRKPFSVSDLTAGAWCEQQYFYTLTRLPGGRKTRTAAMKGGTKLHQQLEAEVHTMVQVSVETPEDAFGLRLWNVVQGLRTLRDAGRTRELEVWGVLDGDVLVNGVIDYLSYENPEPGFEEEVLSSQEGGGRGSKGKANKRKKKDEDTIKADRRITDFFPSSSGGREDPKDARQVYIMDVKTRARPSFPSAVQERGTKVQLFLYHRFLAAMAADALDYGAVFARYALRPDEPFSDAFVAQIGALHGEIFEEDSPSPEWEEEEDGSDYVSAASTVGQGEKEADGGGEGGAGLRYNTLAALAALLRKELRRTFPRGAASLGQVVSVEYRYRPRGPRPSPAVTSPDADTATNPDTQLQAGAAGDQDADDDGDDTMPSGAVIGVHTFFVDAGVLARYVARELEWWRGERSPVGVKLEEAYKCGGCEFADVCEWRAGQEREVWERSKAGRGRGRGPRAEVM